MYAHPSGERREKQLTVHDPQGGCWGVCIVHLASRVHTDDQTVPNLRRQGLPPCLSKKCCRSSVEGQLRVVVVNHRRLTANRYRSNGNCHCLHGDCRAMAGVQRFAHWGRTVRCAKSTHPPCPDTGLSRRGNPVFPHFSAFLKSLLLWFQSNGECGCGFVPAAGRVNWCSCNSMCSCVSGWKQGVKHGWVWTQGCGPRLIQASLGRSWFSDASEHQCSQTSHSPTRHAKGQHGIIFVDSLC